MSLSNLVHRGHRSRSSLSQLARPSLAFLEPLFLIDITDDVNNIYLVYFYQQKFVRCCHFGLWSPWPGYGEDFTWPTVSCGCWFFSVFVTYYKWVFYEVLYCDHVLSVVHLSSSSAATEQILTKLNRKGVLNALYQVFWTDSVIENG